MGETASSSLDAGARETHLPYWCWGFQQENGSYQGLCSTGSSELFPKASWEPSVDCGLGHGRLKNHKRVSEKNDPAAVFGWRKEVRSRAVREPGPAAVPAGRSEWQDKGSGDGDPGGHGGVWPKIKQQAQPRPLEGLLCSGPPHVRWTS